MKYLHTMIRVLDPEKTIEFFKLLGFKEIRRKENEQYKFTLIFLATAEGETEIELTYNWDQTEKYTEGRNFGHIAISTPDIYKTCETLQEAGITILRPPRDGHMAFIRTPDQISIELIQEGDSLPPKEPWLSAENIGTW